MRFFSLVLPLFSQTSDIISVHLFAAFSLMKFNLHPPQHTHSALRVCLVLFPSFCGEFSVLSSSRRLFPPIRCHINIRGPRCFLENAGRTLFSSHKQRPFSLAGAAGQPVNTGIHSEDIICENAARVWVGKVTKSIQNKHTRPLMYFSASVLR